MKLLCVMLIGILIGIFMCVSLFEIIHLSVEVSGFPMCSIIYDRLTQQYRPDFVYQLRVIYKFFAYPIKTTWIALSEHGDIAIANGKGERTCYGDWKFKKYWDK